MIKIIKSILKNKWMLRSLAKTVYFNFHYFPFKIAIKLPVLLYKPKLKDIKGKFNILVEPKNIKFGMIQLGCCIANVYPNTGIVIENHGGVVNFHGECKIGGNSAICIAKNGILNIGGKFLSNSTLKIICYHRINLGNRLRIGWDCMMMDSDFHKITKLSGGYSKGYAPINIGDNCWLGTGCLVMKRTTLPAFTIVQARSVLNMPYDIPEYSIIGPDTNVIVKAHGMYRNIQDDTIDFPPINE